MDKIRGWVCYSRSAPIVQFQHRKDGGMAIPFATTGGAVVGS